VTRPLKTPNIFLFLDYDGTLVSIKKRPELALLHASKKKILKDLNEKYFLAIVTGRALKDIKAMVGTQNAAYIGNHGLEIFFQGKHWVHPQARKISITLKNCLKILKTRIQSLPGVRIEDKTLTASIHYRAMAANTKFILKALILKEITAAKGLLKSTDGKKVFEIRPNIEWDKGRGIQHLLQWIPRSANKLKIYVGDDMTDEDAFKIFNQNDMTIRVGSGKKTRAFYRFKTVGHVWKFLSILSGFDLQQPKDTAARMNRNLKRDAG